MSCRQSLVDNMAVVTHEFTRQGVRYELVSVCPPGIWLVRSRETLGGKWRVLRAARFVPPSDATDQEAAESGLELAKRWAEARLD